MKLKEDNIDIYNNSAIILNKNNSFYSTSWIIIISILFILFIICSFITFNVYKNYNGYIVLDNNNSYVNLVLEKEDFPINKNNKLYIENNNYKYNVVNINENDVLLSVELEEYIKVNNNIVQVSILKDRTSLFKIIKNKIKKGFDL